MPLSTISLLHFEKRYCDIPHFTFECRIEGPSSVAMDIGAVMGIGDI